MNQRFRPSAQDLASNNNPLDGDVVEIPLLLPTWAATALESVAHHRGLTAAEMVRHLLSDFIVQASWTDPDAVCASSSNGNSR